ncbi:MAG: type II toxin-antitoxin system VapC family toxin [Proteobacteria bacterium]|nr:type II toxin-antitoxin system VapC family toxin [Pseudomonadota bacterium]
MQKVFFDTNFLLRYYLDDVPSQAKKAKTMIEAAINGELELTTDLVVICEMVWVMDSYYELDRESIVDKISNLYQTPGIRVINGDILPNALIGYMEKNVDFTDAVIAASAISNGIRHIAFFDKRDMKRWSDSGLERIESLEELRSDI